VGAGLNSVSPPGWRCGEDLPRQALNPALTYPTVVSSFFVGSVFDTSAGILVFIYALTQGLLPKPPELPDLPAFDIAFWAPAPELPRLHLTALRHCGR